jgi:hypothetical protein
MSLKEFEMQNLKQNKRPCRRSYAWMSTSARKKLRALKKTIAAKKIQKNFREYLNNTRENCAICLQFMPNDIEPRIESNNESDINKNKFCHKFHKKCIKTWLSNSNSNGRCPICRSQIIDLHSDIYVRKLKFQLLHIMSENNLIHLLHTVIKKKNEAMNLRLDILKNHIYYLYYNEWDKLENQNCDEFIYNKSIEFIDGPLINNDSPLNNLIMRESPQLQKKYTIIIAAEYACTTLLQGYLNIDEISVSQLIMSSEFLRIDFLSSIMEWERLNFPELSINIQNLYNLAETRAFLESEFV